MSTLWKASQHPKPLGLLGNQQGRFRNVASLPITWASLSGPILPKVKLVGGISYLSWFLPWLLCISQDSSRLTST